MQFSFPTRIIKLTDVVLFVEVGWLSAWMEMKMLLPHAARFLVI